MPLTMCQTGPQGTAPSFSIMATIPLHPLQLFHSPEETSIEAVAQFTSRLRNDFRMALQHLKEASEQMRKQADRYRRAVEYQEGDMVLLSTKEYPI